MEKEKILVNWGLQEKEAKAYLALLELGSSTIKPIADKSGIKRTSIYNFIDRLVELGLVTQTKVNNRLRYSAISPERLLEIEKEKLRNIQNTLPEFLGLYNFSVKKPKIQYFEGPEQMKNIVREELRCLKECLYIWTGAPIIEMIGGAKFMAEIDRQRIEKGVEVKTIRFRKQDVPYKFSITGPKFLRQLRWGPDNLNLSMSMGIYDTGKVSFFSSKFEGFGIVIESKELEQLMRIFHQLLWEKSRPAKPGEG